MNDSVRSPPRHARRNRVHWDAAAEYVGPGTRVGSPGTDLGIWRVPDSELHVLPEDLAGKDVIELGCGTASSRRGSPAAGRAWRDRQLRRPAGDGSPAEREHGLALTLIHGNAEQVPYPDASFDLAISEYGACLWADPFRWVPEAARILRPGGVLIFLVNSALLTLCMPEEDALAASARLLRPAFGMYRIEWPGDMGVEFHLSHGDWLRLLRRSGFEIEDLIEVQAPEAGTTRYPFVTLAVGAPVASEEIWKARRRADDDTLRGQA